MIVGFLWFQGTFAQLLVVYKSWKRRMFSQTFFTSEVGRKKKTKKKQNEKTAVLIKAVYEMIDKMAPVTSLEFTVTVFFLGLELKKGLSVIFKVR